MYIIKIKDWKCYSFQGIRPRKKIQIIWETYNNNIWPIFRWISTPAGKLTFAEAAGWWLSRWGPRELVHTVCPQQGLCIRIPWASLHSFWSYQKFH